MFQTYLTANSTVLPLSRLYQAFITPARKFRMLLHTNPTRERGECPEPAWRVGRHVRFESPLHAGLQAEGPVAGVSG